MDVFNLRQQLVSDYRAYSESFIKVRDPNIREYIDAELKSGALWPDPVWCNYYDRDSMRQVAACFDSSSTMDQ